MSKRKPRKARRNGLNGRTRRPGTGTLRLSACLIVKNEAECLDECLASLDGLVQEIIVLDTGSTDGTQDVARARGAQVFECAWPDSFAAARNMSVTHATGDWVLVVDADEVIARRDHAAIRKLLSAPADVMGYLLMQRNYTSDQTTARWQRTEPNCPEARGMAGWFPAPITRLFRRSEHIRFAGEVHEGVDDSIVAAGGRIRDTTIPIHHYGKLRDEDRMLAKAELYRTLGEQKAERTDSAKAHFELGLQYAELGLLEKAEAALRRAVATDAAYVKAWGDLGSVLERQGQMTEGIKAYRRALAIDPHYLPALVNLGAALGKVGAHAEAGEVFACARSLNAENPIILNNLAAHYVHRGDPATAEQLYREAIHVNPEYVQAHVNLGNLLESTGRYDDAADELRATCERFPRHAPAHAALALVHIRRSEWADAAAAGERAVALDASNAVVWTNVGVARFQLGRIEGAVHATYQATRADPAYEPATRNWAQLSAQYPDIAAHLTDPPARIEVCTGPRIAFLHQGLGFTGNTLRERGLGGTESAVVRMSEALAKRGCRVTVFNRCDVPADEYGVAYRPVATAGAALEAAPPAALIAARSWQGLDLAPADTLRVLWAHDAADQPAVQGLADPRTRECIDRYLGISAWQIAQYTERFGIPEYLWTQTRNAVAADLFAGHAGTRDRQKLVYTSTPFRGLDVLLDVFPRIRAAVPEATLDLYTSMAVYGVSAEADRAQFGNLYARAEQPGVRLVGSVPQPELAAALQEAGLLAYPNHFAETSCIAALEAQAAGCPVVTSALGALPETVAHGVSGWCIPGDPRSAAYQDAFVEAVVTLLRDADQWQAFSTHARARILDRYTWDAVAEEWLDLFAAAVV